MTSRWTLAQGRSDRCTQWAGSMVKKVALSLLALTPFLYTTGYVIPSMSHSSRFGSEAGHVLQAISNTSVREGTNPHREAMGLLSRCCGVVATLSIWLTSSWRPTADVIMHYVIPQTQSRLASSEVLERRSGAVELDKLEALFLPHGQANEIYKIHLRHFMKYNYDIQNGSVPDRTTANFPNEITTNNSGDHNIIGHSGTNDTIYQSGTSINHGGATEGVLKENAFPILLVIPRLLRRIDVASKNRWWKRSRAQSCAPRDLT